MVIGRRVGRSDAGSRSDGGETLRRFASEAGRLRGQTPRRSAADAESVSVGDPPPRLFAQRQRPRAARSPAAEPQRRAAETAAEPIARSASASRSGRYARVASRAACGGRAPNRRRSSLGPSSTQPVAAPEPPDRLHDDLGLAYAAKMLCPDTTEATFRYTAAMSARNAGRACRTGVAELLRGRLRQR